MAPEVRLEPVGRVAGGRDEVRDDGWGPVRAVLELDPVRFGPEAVAGLEAFSHLEVVFLFDRVEEPAVETGARHPRGNAAWPRVGIFAQRAKDRPNRLGVSRCRLLDVDGLRLAVEGLDAVAGTPVLDVKPWMAELAPQGPVRQPAWARELMAGYWTAADA
jgi:tRNA-Thr(GGU) m(6)t(6)A37 methyltransferase TsaA